MWEDAEPVQLWKGSSAKLRLRHFFINLFNNLLLSTALYMPRPELQKDESDPVAALELLRGKGI